MSECSSLCNGCRVPKGGEGAPIGMGFYIGLPKKICGAKIFWEEGGTGKKAKGMSECSSLCNGCRVPKGGEGAPIGMGFYIGLPKKICGAKIFWEEGGTGKKAKGMSECSSLCNGCRVPKGGKGAPIKMGFYIGFPKKICGAKIFWEEGGTGKKAEGMSECSSLCNGCRVPTWYRRAASNRYAFRHRILSPARLPISPRRHLLKSIPKPPPDGK